MDALFINKHKFSSLEKYVLNKDIVNTECNLYIWDTKASKKLLKIFFVNNGLYFGNKLLTINSLIDYQHEINIEELVIPEKIVAINNKVSGFSMPYIENINLQTILKDKNVPIKTKVNYLKQVGKIIEKVHKTTPCNQPFLLSDVHEANFIYDIDKKRICAVDLDSCKIGNNKPSSIKYLSTNPNIKYLLYKYPSDDNMKYMPNVNSDLLCYIFMILNTISYGDIHKLSIIDYYSYLQYLKDLGFSNEIIDCFNHIYTGHDNISPCELLDEIVYNSNTPRAHYKVFETLKNKRKY